MTTPSLKSLQQKLLPISFLVLFSFSFCNGNITTSEGTEGSATVEADKPSNVEMTVTNSRLKICTFNIQFLGSFKKRDNKALADLLKEFDIVVIQELVAPPVDGVYPDGTPYKADVEAASFFKAMAEKGFEHKLSEEDTGTGEEIHKKSSATEWWVSFYKPDKVGLATDLPGGFLADDRSNHPDYERVPYAFPFRDIGGSLDFVLISVHLMPGGNEEGTARRKQEIQAIYQWIEANNSKEKDFIILGDMNIEDEEELADVLPEGYESLNNECRRTNTLINDKPGNGAKPYDHIMYHSTFTAKEVDLQFDCQVINLIDAMKASWTAPETYPGEPYVHNLFKQYYSDHHPVRFQLIPPQQDDD